MQEQDKVIIKTELFKGIISKLLHEVMENAGYNVGFQVNDLNVINDGETMFVHMDMGVDGYLQDLKKICIGFTILKNLAKFISNNHLNFLFELLFKTIIKIAAKKNIDVQINKVNIDERNGELHISLNVDGKIRNEDFKMILKDAGLV